MSQRPEPVASALPQTLSSFQPRFQFALPAKTAGPLRMKWNERVSRLEHKQKDLQAILATVPGLSAADRKSIQNEMDNACAQVGTLRAEQANRIPEPPETPAVPFDEWPARGTRLMP